MPITLLDGILVGFTLVSAMLAMVRGFSREILSIASWAAAAAAAFFFYPLVLPYVQPYIDNEQIAMAAAAGVVFVVALIVVTLITMKIADWIIDSRIGALDRTLGFLYGAARGILVVAVGAAVLQLAGRRQPAGLGRRGEVAPAARIDRHGAGEHAARRSGELDPEAAVAATDRRAARSRHRSAAGRNAAGRDSRRDAAGRRPPANNCRMAPRKRAVPDMSVLVTRVARRPRCPICRLSDETPDGRLSLLAEADDHFHDECGVFGIFGRQDAAAIVTLGLHALQHRGQEAAGIVSYDGTQFHVERHVGLIGDTFTKPAVIEQPEGQPRHRPHALRHDRRLRPAQRAAAFSPSLPTAASPSPTTATSPTP